MKILAGDEPYNVLIFDYDLPGHNGIELTCHARALPQDRKSTRLNSSHTEIYTLSLPDSLPIYEDSRRRRALQRSHLRLRFARPQRNRADVPRPRTPTRSEEHTSELQSH